jgi:aspartate/methionine/tyrosine aminotransferase
MKRIHALNQWQHFCVSTPTQVAAASALALAAQPYDPLEDGDAIPDPFTNGPIEGGAFPYLGVPSAHETHSHYSYFQHVQCQYEYKRQLLADALTVGGITPVLPDSGIFIMGDTSELQTPEEYFSPRSEAHPAGMTRDWATVRFLAQEAGVVAIPPSAFHSHATADCSSDYIRFSFGKQSAQLVQAHARLRAFASR